MHNRVYNTRAIIESGLLIIFIVIIKLLNTYIPFFELVGFFILPIPITVIYIRHNYKVTIGAIVVSAVLLLMIFDPLTALTSSIMVGFAGITLGYCIKHDKKASTTILFLAIAFIIVWIINVTIYSTLIDKGGIVAILDKSIKAMNESFNMVKGTYMKMGISKEQIASMENMYKNINTDSILKVMPFSLIMLSICLAYLNYTITRNILKRLNYTMREIKPFSQLYINTRIGTIVGLIFIIGLLLNRSNIALKEYIVICSQAVFQLTVMLNGLAVATYYLRRKYNLSKAVTVLILIFTSTSQFYVIYVYAGLLDIIFDFRKLDPYRKPRTE